MPQLRNFILPMLIMHAASAAVGGATPTPSPKPATAKTTRILIMGDSLTEASGIAKEDTYAVLAERRLHELGHKNVEVIAAGTGGATSASAVRELERWHFKNPPQILVLALGANDGLRGIKVEETRKNLSAAIEKAKAKNVRVVLAGMKMPPNFGKEYTRDFEQTFTLLSKKHKITLIPFLLEGVGGDPAMNQADGIHPNEKGHKVIAETVAKALDKIL